MFAIKAARTILIGLAFASVAAVLLAASAPVAAQRDGGQGGDLARVRAATAHYRDLEVAQAAGYGLLTDARGIACIDNPGVGAMGVHYVKGALVASGVIDALRPQALVYEPREDGGLRLVAVEYVTFRAQWDAAHAAPPMLFGRRFMLTPAPNRYGLPAFYSLHAWIWKHNPSGTFAMWNPRVRCAAADPEDRRDAATATALLA